ncbi:response regulator transcription factor [Ammoniphilus resinae]|uniref:Two-component system response regulator ResD n=1 Tax=Ammoniphilus resinae TaxID=861532 RepID=A0ABS4GLJ2_9BACL|nr:two-component system response regulator ResD [Ammoniphilus resinae]
MEGSFRILVVDDEAPMRQLLKLYLTKDRYEVQTAANGEEALSLFKQGGFDMVILDIMMPGIDGWEVCQRIRSFSQIPILMLTARDQTMEKVKGLKMGADDYLTKPFEEAELSARMEALLRRVSKPEHSRIDPHGITVNPETHKVIYQGQPIELTPKEFELLHTFMNNVGRVYSRELLLEMIWGPDYMGDTRTVDSHVKNLREKLRKHGVDVDSVIKTVWGVGYKGV